MRCDTARPALSAAFDGEPVDVAPEQLDAHVGACPDCAAYRARLAALRRNLRFQLVDELPDLAPAVRRHLPPTPGPASSPGAARRRPPAWAAVAAVFVAAAVAGASFVGPTRRPLQRVAADPLPERVVAAQADLRTLRSRLHVVERGWHPERPVRRLSGRLAYRAPESLVVVLREDAATAGRRSSTTVVADADRWWARGAVACPVALWPRCPADGSRVEAVAGREPFGDAGPVPLDLVLPARSFVLAAPPAPLPARRVDGRDTVGVAVTVAQVQPLLDGLRQRGVWRDLYPADRVELWLDADALVPLALRVLPEPSADRRWWAARHGYADPPGRVLLDLRLSDVRINHPLAPGAFPTAPRAARVRHAGFHDRPVRDPATRPRWLPAGMRAYRTGLLRGRGGPAVRVATWSDGRAWIKVKAVRGWRGDRLFGDPGAIVRRVRLPAGGTAYLAEGGQRVAIHARDVDVEVSGSVPPGQLRRVAASLPLRGRPVPASWAESEATSLADARRALPRLLVPPALDGFGPPAVAVRGRTVSLVCTGAGARGFLLTQQPGRHLAPPLEPDVRGVRVRGRAGRYTPGSGELEWVEAAGLRSLRSRTLSLAELVAVAEALR